MAKFPEIGAIIKCLQSLSWFCGGGLFPDDPLAAADDGRCQADTGHKQD